MINQLDALISHGRQLFLSLSPLGETGIDASPGIKEQMDKKSVEITNGTVSRDFLLLVFFLNQFPPSL
jgi:hypothetical protein